MSCDLTSLVYLTFAFIILECSFKKFENPEDFAEKRRALRIGYCFFAILLTLLCIVHIFYGQIGSLFDSPLCKKLCANYGTVLIDAMIVWPIFYKHYLENKVEDQGAGLNSFMQDQKKN